MDTTIASPPDAFTPTLLSHLLRSADPEAPVLLCADKAWTSSELRTAVDQFATGLLSLGIGKGDRVAVAAPNSAQWLITWFATARIGAILVTLNVAYRDQEFDYMLNQSSARMLICCAENGGFDFVHFLNGLRPRLKTVQHYVFLGGEGFPGSMRWNDLTSSIDVDALRDHESQVRSDDPAVLLYTSGTTGQPKGATLTHRSILGSALAQADHLRLGANNVAIGHMPLNHVGGMTCTVAATMVAGGRVVLLPRFDPTQALDAIRRHGVTTYIGVPTMYTMLMDHPDFSPEAVTSIRTCIIGGSNMEPALGRRILANFAGARMANLYGLSETSGGCIISAIDDDLDTLVDTLGVPIGGFEISITDANHKPLPVGSEGQLRVRGQCVAAGYWQKPQETSQAFLPDNWLDTGDMAVLRPDGRIALRGRLKEMYVRSGYNVYPVEVENVLARHPEVAMSAVVGMPDPFYGEVGYAYVVPSPGHIIDTDDLLAKCAKQLAKYKLPAKILVVDSLPLTPSGKIKKVELRDREV
ncbi:MAG: acyl--CoA ligase [Mycolicibacterium cosmeticum]|nr:acyl--CoA ligase [Mycolicibacterium cosmeticum]